MKITDLSLINPHADARPSGTTIDTVVVHSMYAEACKQPFDIERCHELLAQHHVSTHFYIGTDGALYASIPTELRAWHAGTSQMPFPDDSRAAVNDFSIGIELIGDPAKGFQPPQYESLLFLIQNIASKHPISAIVGHDQIAPGRKQDPGALFDWNKLKQKCSPTIRFVT